MKKLQSLFALLLMVLTCTISANAKKTECAGVDATREGMLAKFDKFIVNGAYDVRLVAGSHYSYKITCDANFLDFMLISQKDNEVKAIIKPYRTKCTVKPVLEITYPNDNTFDNLNIEANAGAKINADKLVIKSTLDIEANAASSFISLGVTAPEIKIELNARSIANINSIDATSLNVEINSASECIIAGHASKAMDFELNAGSKLNVSRADTPSLKVEGSSSSSAVINNISGEKLNAEVSSSATCDLSGRVSNVEVEATSSAKIGAKGLTSDKLKCEASSGAEIHMGVVEKEIKSAKASSGARITYGGTPKVSNIKNDSGASVTKE